VKRPTERTSGRSHNVTARAGRWTVAVLSAAVALYSLRFYGVLGDRWWDIDPGIRHVIDTIPARSLLHMLVAPIALLIGPVQFFPEIRSRHPSFHRWLGRLYVCTCVVAGVGALATSPFASGGPVAAVGFGILAVAWIATTISAWLAATRRRFELHRVAMRFSYAMTFAAVTLRLQIPIGYAVGYESYSSMSPWLAYTCWIPNVILVAIYSRLERSRRKRLTEHAAGLTAASGS
jgi:uncharacterized membrane protein